jgi:hypothetical protein
MMQLRCLKFLAVLGVLLSLTACPVPLSIMKTLDPTMERNNGCITFQQALSFRPEGTYQITAAGITDNSRDGYTLAPRGLIERAGSPVVWMYHYLTYVTWYSAGAVYSGIATNPSFVLFVKSLVTLSVMFYSIAVLLAIIPVRLYDVVIYGIKIAVIMAFALRRSA